MSFLQDCMYMITIAKLSMTVLHGKLDYLFFSFKIKYYIYLFLVLIYFSCFKIFINLFIHSLIYLFAYLLVFKIIYLLVSYWLKLFTIESVKIYFFKK